MAIQEVRLVNDDWLGRVEIERQACRGILIRDGRVLLSYERKNDICLIPGGGLEQDETLSQCCARELLEETGILCAPVREYLVIEELFDVWRHVNHYFVCEMLENTGVQHLTAGEAAADTTFVWMPLEEALRLFGEYERFRSVNIANYGLYRREYTALKAFPELKD